MADTDPKTGMTTGGGLSRAIAVGRRSATRVWTSLSDAVFPPVCLACRTPLASHDGLCVACWSGVDFIRAPICDRLGLPMPFDTGGVMVSAAATADPPNYDRARAVARYDGTMRRLVHDFKFRDRLEVRHLLAQWLAQAASAVIADGQVVVPVPLSRRRLLWRRFNQAAMLGRELARLKFLDFEIEALVRTRTTPSQVGLTRTQRRENVRGAFVVASERKHRINGRSILLIDDIITTGATASAAAKALKRAGAARVDVVALAIVTDEALVPA